MLLYVCVWVAPATCCPCQSCSSGKGLFLCYCKSAAYAALAKLAVNIRKRCFQGFSIQAVVDDCFPPDNEIFRFQLVDPLFFKIGFDFCFQGFRLLLQFLLLGFDCLQFLNSVLDLSFCHGFVLLSWFCLEAQHREALRRIAAVRLSLYPVRVYRRSSVSVWLFFFNCLYYSTCTCMFQLAYPTNMYIYFCLFYTCTYIESYAIINTYWRRYLYFRAPPLYCERRCILWH